MQAIEKVMQMRIFHIEIYKTKLLFALIGFCAHTKKGKPTGKCEKMNLQAITKRMTKSQEVTRVPDHALITWLTIH